MTLDIQADKYQKKSSFDAFDKAYLIKGKPLQINQ